MSDPLIAFYLGKGGTGPSCQTLEKIWQWERERLEDERDHLQWLFSLTEKSSCNPLAPAFTAQSTERFRTAALLPSRLKRSFEIMLDFWGL